MCRCGVVVFFVYCQLVLCVVLCCVCVCVCVCVCAKLAACTGDTAQRLSNLGVAGCLRRNVMITCEINYSKDDLKGKI